MAEPPKNNQSHIFSFQIQPASKLKHTIKALSDADFNPLGTGLIEVGPKTIEITVHNSDTGVKGYLRLLCSGLIDFHYSGSLEKKLIDLNQMSQNLSAVDDDETIGIHHVAGSDELCLVFEKFAEGNFCVRLLEIRVQLLRLPDIIYACEVVVLSKNLREIIHQIEISEEAQKLVMFDVCDSTMAIYVGEVPMYFLVHKKKIGIRGLEQNQKHSASFRWPHCESLKAASFVAEGVLVCPVTAPPEHMMLRFNLQELGDLVFVKAATNFQPNIKPETQDSSSGTDKPTSRN